MFVWLEILDTRQFTGQFFRVVNQNWEMLGADIKMMILVFQADKGNFIAGVFTYQAGVFYVGHNTSNVDK
jgi:hypothetical protein